MSQKMNWNSYNPVDILTRYLRADWMISKAKQPKEISNEDLRAFLDHD